MAPSPRLDHYGDCRRLPHAKKRAPPGHSTNDPAELPARCSEAQCRAPAAAFSNAHSKLLPSEEIGRAGRCANAPAMCGSCARRRGGDGVVEAWRTHQTESFCYKSLLSCTFLPSCIREIGREGVTRCSIGVQNDWYHKPPLSDTECTPSSSSLNRSCQVAHLQVDSTPFITAVTSVTHANSRARGCCLIYHVSCTRTKALGARMMCTLQLSKSSCLCVLQQLNAAYHRARPRTAAQGGRTSQEVRGELRCLTSPCTAGGGLMLLAGS